MRKRWTFSPGPFIGLAAFLWVVSIVVVAITTNGCQHDNPHLCGIDGPLSRADAIVMFGPLAVGAAVVLVVIAYMSALALWEARPRRIEEPVTDDLREIEPPGEQDQSPSSGA